MLLILIKVDLFLGRQEGHYIIAILFMFRTRVSAPCNSLRFQQFFLYPTGTFTCFLISFQISWSLLTLPIFCKHSHVLWTYKSSSRYCAGHNYFERTFIISYVVFELTVPFQVCYSNSMFLVFNTYDTVKVIYLGFVWF